MGFPTAARTHLATATRPTQTEGTLTQTTIRVVIRLVRTTTPEMDIPFTKAAMERLFTKTPTRVPGATATLDLDLVAREDRARSNHLQRQPSGFEIIDESDLHQYIHKIHFRFLDVSNTNLEKNCYRVLNSN